MMRPTSFVKQHVHEIDRPHQDCHRGNFLQRPSVVRPDADIDHNDGRKQHGGRRNSRRANVKTADQGQSHQPLQNRYREKGPVSEGEGGRD